MKFVNPLGGTFYERAWGPNAGTHAPGQNWQSTWGWDLLHSSDDHPVFAAVSGIIASVGDGGSGRFAGKKIGIEGDDGVSVFYTHMSKVYPSYGARVEAGDLIGITGKAVGVYHLHFAMARGSYRGGQGIDPRKYLDESAEFHGPGPNKYPMYRGNIMAGPDKRTLQQRLVAAGFGAKSARQVPAVLKKWQAAGAPKGKPRKGDSKLFRRLRGSGFGVNSARKIVKSLRRPY